MMFWLFLSTFFILMQGLFAGMETGMVSILRPRAEHAFKTNPEKNVNRMMFFLNHPNIMISTTLIGVNISVVFASLSFKNFMAACGFSGGLSIAISSIILSLLCLIVEIIPKDWFRQSPFQRCLNLIPLLHGTYTVLKPIVHFFAALTSFLNKYVAKVKEEPHEQVMRQALSLFIRESEGYGTLDSATVSVLNHAMKLPSVKLSDLATPLDEVKSVPYNATIREAFDFAAEQDLEKLPVCRISQDGSKICIGVFDSYDVIAQIDEAHWEETNVCSCIKKANELSSDDDLTLAVSIAERERVGLFVILDKNKKQTGVLTPEKIAELLFE